jgi:hypothetical protein
MTANELANKLKLFWHTENDSLFEQASTMLRQQAQEIVMLKQIIDANNLKSDVGQLKKAREQFCNKCNNTGWVCEWHPNKEAHKCCGGAGMPCECTKESR